MRHWRGCEALGTPAADSDLGAADSPRQYPFPVPGFCTRAGHARLAIEARVSLRRGLPPDRAPQPEATDRGKTEQREGGRLRDRERDGVDVDHQIGCVRAEINSRLIDDVQVHEIGE